VHVSDQLSAPTIPTLPGTVAVGSDHAGFALKQALVEHLAGRGIAIVDVGAHSTDRVDYPDYGAEVGRAVVSAVPRSASPSAAPGWASAWRPTR
jgi:hypothetical protein